MSDMSDQIDAQELLVLTDVQNTKPKMKFALVFWLGDKKVSIIPLTNIPSDANRKEGVVGHAKWRKKLYAAKVLKISGRLNPLRKMQMVSLATRS